MVYTSWLKLAKYAAPIPPDRLPLVTVTHVVLASLTQTTPSTACVVPCTVTALNGSVAVVNSHRWLKCVVVVPSQMVVLMISMSTRNVVEVTMFQSRISAATQHLENIR